MCSVGCTMFKQIFKFIGNLKPIYKIILVAAVVVILLGILLAIGFSNHYYTIKCRDEIEEYSFKLHHCTSDVFEHTEGFKQLELSLIKYNWTHYHSCDLGFKMLKCLYGIRPVDDDCDEKPDAERLFNIHKVIVESIQFLCIDSYINYSIVDSTNLNDCNSESLINYDNCIELEQRHNNVTELNSFLNRYICRNFDLKLVCSENLNACFNVEQQQLMDSAYRNLKLWFVCP